MNRQMDRVASYLWSWDGSHFMEFNFARVTLNLIDKIRMLDKTDSFLLQDTKKITYYSDLKIRFFLQRKKADRSI